MLQSFGFKNTYEDMSKMLQYFSNLFPLFFKLEQNQRNVQRSGGEDFVV